LPLPSSALVFAFGSLSIRPRHSPLNDTPRRGNSRHSSLARAG
jgi:hypothetical protein